MAVAQNISQTEDTFATESITCLIEAIDAAIDAAIEVGYEGPVDGDEPQPVKDARKAYWQTIHGLWGAGKVGISREDEYLVLRYKNHIKTYRGSSVDGCGYDDDFVCHLARQFRDETDLALASKLNPKAL